MLQFWVKILQMKVVNITPRGYRWIRNPATFSIGLHSSNGDVSSHRSHESHPVTLGWAADWAWCILQRCGGYPRPLRVYDVGRGNKWWRYQSQACLLCSSQTRAVLRAARSLLVSTDCNDEKRWFFPTPIWNKCDLDIAGREAYCNFKSFSIRFFLSLSKFKHIPLKEGGGYRCACPWFLEMKRVWTANWKYTRQASHGKGQSRIKAVVPYLSSSCPT